MIVKLVSKGEAKETVYYEGKTITWSDSMGAENFRLWVDRDDDATFLDARGFNIYIMNSNGKTIDSLAL